MNNDFVIEIKIKKTINKSYRNLQRILHYWNYDKVCYDEEEYVSVHYYFVAYALDKAKKLPRI